MTLRKNKTLAITLLYFSISLAWILLSDFLINAIPFNGNQPLQTFKGTFFVIATSALLYVLVRRYHNKVSESDQLYRGFFENCPVPMWIFDRKTLRFINVNEAAVGQYGYSRSEFLSMTIADIRPEHDRLNLERFIARERGEDFRDSGIWQHRTKDGSLIFVNIVSQRLPSNQGDRVMVMAKDTTETVIFENKLKQANDELEATNKDIRMKKRFLKEVQEMAKIGGWEYHPSENRFFFSDEVIKILGFNPGDHENPFQAMLDHVHPDDLDQFLEERAAFDRNGQTLKSTLRFITDAGTVKYLHRIIRFEYLDGAPYRVRGTMQDVTYQKLVELERDQALKRYDLICDVTQDMIYEYDIASNNVSYSRNFDKITNPAMLQETDPAKAWFNIIHPDDLQRVIAANQGAMTSGETNYTCEYRISMDGSEYRHVLDQARILYENGKPVRLVGSVSDIHEIRHVAAENYRLGEVINKVENMALIIDTENKIMWMNRAMERFTNLALQDVIGRSPAELLAGEFRDAEISRSLCGRIDRRESFSTELPIYGFNNKERWAKSEFKPLFDDEGQYTGYLVIHTDVSELKEKERFLSCQNEALKDIAWMESHELRRPLASLLGLVNIMRDTDRIDEKEEYIGLINVCAEEMDEMVHKISTKIYDTLYAIDPLWT